MTHNTSNPALPAYRLVDDSGGLDFLARRLAAESAIGVDLEADSMFHYQEKVCLIQIATPGENILLDTLAVRDLAALKPVFADSRVRKVFHGADYDIRSLYRDFGLEVNGLFDTQIAARFLGCDETGLASLLRKYFGLELSKKYQKKDWSERPLPPEMLAYATLDAYYLLPLAARLEGELEARGRHPWVREECIRLTQVRAGNARDGHPFLRVKGASALDSRGLAVLEAALRFRDEVARDRDRPPFKIISNASLLLIAQRRPTRIEDLGADQGLSERQIRALGKGLIQAVAEALTLPVGLLPEFPRPARSPIRGREKRCMAELKRWREETAARLGLDGPLILTNEQIKSLALARPAEKARLRPIIRDWQARMFAGDIRSILAKY